MHLDTVALVIASLEASYERPEILTGGQIKKVKNCPPTLIKRMSDIIVREATESLLFQRSKY